MQKQDIAKIKETLEKERDKIKTILSRRAHKDPKVAGNYITDFPEVGNETQDEVFEDVTYEENLAVEQVLETRLLKIEKDLQAIEAGTYQTT